MEQISDFKCRYIKKSEIWAIAEKFRNEFWSENTIPVDIENIVENRLKLNIEPEHNLLNKYDSDAYLRVDLTGIIVDYVRYMEDRFTNRLRFSFAHELGHLFLHKNIYSEFGITDPKTWKNFMRDISEKEYKFFEGQANEFAGRVLVPRDSLINELEKCLTQIKDHGLLNLLSNPDSVLESISPALCKPFGVSDQVIEIRVRKEDIWPPKIEYVDGVGVKLLE